MHPEARDRTKEEVLRLIRASRNLTRADLVDLTGLPASTITSAVRRLQAEGSIASAPSQPKGAGSGSGRPALALNAVTRPGTTGAIDFGHGHIRVALGDNIGTCVAEELVKFDVDLRSADAIELASARLKLLQKTSGVEPVSVVVAGMPDLVAGMPGPVDLQTGIASSTASPPNWVGLNPVQELTTRIGAPIHVENDAALGAFGELAAGVGKVHRDFVYVKASHGIGSALVLGGVVYTGSSGIAGEIGHTQLAGRSELCRCGNRGCLEAVVSAQALREQIAQTHPHLRNCEIVFSELEDTATHRLLHDAGATVGKVLAEIANFINPSAIVVGGELGAAGPAFMNGVRTAVARHAQPAIAAQAAILPAELGTRAELVGALYRAAQHLPSARRAGLSPA